MKITTEPRSDQWNADDLIGGPRDFTIAGVRVGSAEQKYDIQLQGEDRVWRPPLTVLRLLVEAWGDDATVWTGRRVRVYRDPEISFGRDKVGGIRVSHVSHIDGPLTVRLTTARGKRAPVTVQPLPVEEPRPQVTAEQVAACADRAVLRGWWQSAGPELRAAIQSRVADLDAADVAPDGDTTEPEGSR